MRSKRAFTILEMVVVLLVISFLAGATVVSSALIRSNELTNAMSDVGRYTAAINNFRTKYKAMPGDMYQAHLLWGLVSGCSEGYGKPGEVCYGDGNGRVCESLPGGTPIAVQLTMFAEATQEWIELANAGFIEGSYIYIPMQNGITGTSKIGLTYPKTARVGTSFAFYYATCPIINGGLYGDTSPYETHWLVLGSQNGFVGQISDAAVTGEEAFSIDKKTDDGLPGTGKIRGNRNNSGARWGKTACQTADVSTALYDRTPSTPNCFMMFALPE